MSLTLLGSTSPSIHRVCRARRCADLALTAAALAALCHAGLGSVYRIQRRHLPADPAGKPLTLDGGRRWVSQRIHRTLPDIPIIYPEGLTREWQMVLGVAGHCGRRQSGVSAQFSPAPRKTCHHFQPEARKTLAGWRFASLRHKPSRRMTPEVLSTNRSVDRLRAPVSAAQVDRRSLPNPLLRAAGHAPAPSGTAQGLKVIPLSEPRENTPAPFD